MNKSPVPASPIATREAVVGGDAPIEAVPSKEISMHNSAEQERERVLELQAMVQSLDENRFRCVALVSKSPDTPLHLVPPLRKSSARASEKRV
jgi:hypothetical protein